MIDQGSGFQTPVFFGGIWVDVKMLAMDLDRTLLRRDKTVSAYTLGVLEKCREKGMKIVIATARSERAAQRMMDLMHPDGVISSGGAKVTANGKVLCEKKLSVADTQGIIDAARSRSMANLSVETGEGTFVTWREAKHPDHAHGRWWDFAQPLGLAAYKITPEFERAQDAGAVAAQFPWCSMQAYSGEKWYRFARRDAHKLSGIQTLTACWQLSMENVAAFGDDWTDLDMIRGCGIGVAVANAIPEIREAADFITASHEADGVAQWLEKQLL